MNAYRPAGMRMVVRAVVTAALALATAVLGLLTAATPAFAHSGSSVAGTNYKTTLESVTPAFDGATLQVVDLGDQLLLTNDTPNEITVLGYDGEPYLRVSSNGVFQNANSPATYLNLSQDASNTAPPFASSQAAPAWHKVTGGHSVSWHDHRSHWMGLSDPPLVTSAPDQVHMVIPNWEVRFTQGDVTHVATGDVQWIPGPSPVPWLVIAGVLVLIGIAGAVTRTVVAGPGRVVALVLVAVLLVADVAHASGVVTTGAGELSSRISSGLQVFLPSLLAWIVAAVGIRRVMHRDPQAAWFLLFAGLLLCVATGIQSFADLRASQVQTIWPVWVDRLGVAGTLGAGLGLGLCSLASLLKGTRVPSLASRPPESL